MNMKKELFDLLLYVLTTFGYGLAIGLTLFSKPGTTHLELSAWLAIIIGTVFAVRILDRVFALVREGLNSFIEQDEILPKK